MQSTLHYIVIRLKIQADIANEISKYMENDLDKPKKSLNPMKMLGK